MINSVDKVHNKLVRDRIPEVLKEKGISCEIKVLDDQEYHQALLEKLKEEVGEYLSATKTVHQTEELADVIEVVDALLRIHGSTLENLETVLRQKRAERGGFSQRIFLEKNLLSIGKEPHFS